MNINKFNYESFALDYLEGTLSPEMAAEMERFLETHPAIEAELSGMMELMILEPDTSIVYEKKDSLLKEEKVVWLSRKWVRPLMAAASILLLLTTFFVGYQSGVNQSELMVGLESSSDSSRGSSSIDEVVNSKVELPKMESVVAEKIIKVEEKIVRNTSKSKQIFPAENQVEVSIVKAEVIETKVKEKEVYPMQFVDNKSIVVIEKMEENKEIIKKTIYNTPLLESKFGTLTSNTIELSSLEKALQVNTLIDEKTLASYQKRKRSFKDLLGRFPIHNLKEALIPSYYKEEITGQ